VPAPFPSSEVTDDFNRANGAVGAPWADTPNGVSNPGFNVASNQMVGSAGNAWMYYDLALGVIAEARLTVGAYTAGFLELQLLVAAGDANFGGYAVSTDTTTSYIFRYGQGSADTELDSLAGSFTAGDELGMRVLAGGVVEFYGKAAAGEWGLLATVTDPDPIEGDLKAAVFMSATSTTIDDFAVGSLGEEGDSMFHLYRRRRKT
jgi:hypothetical protein